MIVELELWGKKYKGSSIYAFFVSWQTCEQVKLMFKVNHWISHKDMPKFTSRIFEIDLCGNFIACIRTSNTRIPCIRIEFSLYYSKYGPTLLPVVLHTTSSALNQNKFDLVIWDQRFIFCYCSTTFSIREGARNFFLEFTFQVLVLIWSSSRGDRNPKMS